MKRKILITTILTFILLFPVGVNAKDNSIPSILYCPALYGTFSITTIDMSTTWDILTDLYVSGTVSNYETLVILPEQLIVNHRFGYSYNLGHKNNGMIAELRYRRNATGEFLYCNMRQGASYAGIGFGPTIDVLKKIFNR